jgi:acetylornithine deacetylase/succinyl-diaminopimelate desuccinylase-like protein
VQAWTAAHEQEIVAEYLRMVALPDVHGDLPALRKDAAFLTAMLGRHGFAAEEWDGPGAPVVYGEHTVPGAKRTVLFYIHYDGQPVEPKEWAQADPFVPVMRTGALGDAGVKTVEDAAAVTSFPAEWRVYGRATADDRGPIEALCAAMDAIGQAPTSNIRVVLDGEEEGSGPSLADALAMHKAALHADLMVLLDGPQHASGRQTIYYGARGGAGLEVTVYTAKTAMHSGNYGNWMPDANVRLAQLIASMVEPSGRVAIAGFYSDVPPFSPAARKMLNAVPDSSAAMRKQFGLGTTDGAATSLQEGLNLPSFSVHTMHGGEAGGVIAGQATAQIAMRLVVENDPNVMVDRVVAHIKAQGYFVVDHDPDVATLAAHEKVAKVTYRRTTGKGSGAWRTDPATSEARFVRDAFGRVWGDRVVEIRTLGGSVPAVPFIEAEGMPVIGVALVNYDDNQHTNNENLRLGNLWDGIRTLAGVLTY